HSLFTITKHHLLLLFSHSRKLFSFWVEVAGKEKVKVIMFEIHHRNMTGDDCSSSDAGRLCHLHIHGRQNGHGNSKSSDRKQRCDYGCSHDILGDSGLICLWHPFAVKNYTL
ncbi:hypothetical protein Ancab_020801, partial [Ancistrocladus abbreviatus]